MAKKPAEKAKETKKAPAEAKAPKEAKVVKASAEPTAKAKKTEGAKPRKVAAKKEAAAAPAKPCSIKSCKREYRAKGYCSAHYRQWRNGKFGRARYKTCEDVGCLRPMVMNRHGYCEEHYQNYYVKGLEVTKVVAGAKPEKEAEKTAAAS